MSVDSFSEHRFLEDGFIGPLQVLTSAECRRVATYLRRGEHPAPAEWEKGRAVHERIVYELAVQPVLLSRVTTLLGPDVVLWGASAVFRGPGEVHPWHSDFESSAPDGRFVTAWIGLEHTSRESALQLISHSHRVGKTVQELRRERGLRRELTSAEELLEAARQHDPRAALVQPDMADGEAVLFDGRVWHGSLNRRARGRRLALLLQYAAADCSVRIPDLQQLDWPPKLRAAPRPPAILVAGSDSRGVNRLVPAPPPPTKGLPMIATTIHRIQLPAESAKAWEMFPAFRGPTRTVQEMSCHVSMLRGGQQAHPPHVHPEEEFLLPLRGELEVTLASSPHDPSPRRIRVGPGTLMYYAAGQFHTVGNPGREPAAYLMFKWMAPAVKRSGLLGSSVIQHGARRAPESSPPFWSEVLLEGPTANLGRLQSHLTVLAPDAGYAPHVDGYDVALVTLEGTVETLGQRVEPHSVVYYAAGEPHGIRNVGSGPARYLAFEFHAPGMELLTHQEPRARAAARKALGMGRQLVRPLWKRLQAQAATWTGAGPG